MRARASRARESARRAALVVRLPRKRKPAAVGFLEHVTSPLPEDRQGLAVSTLGKVIRRGWDWIGLASSSPGLVGGLIEAPGLCSPSRMVVSKMMSFCLLLMVRS